MSVFFYRRVRRNARSLAMGAAVMLPMLLASIPAASQSFDILGGYRTDTKEFASLLPIGSVSRSGRSTLASEDGRVVLGSVYDQSLNRIVTALLDGDSLRVLSDYRGYIDLPEHGSVGAFIVRGISPDGSTIFGAAQPQTETETVFLWNRRTEAFEQLPMPSVFVENHDVMDVWLSSDGTVVGATVRDAALANFGRRWTTVRWRDGELDLLQHHFWAAGMADDGTFAGADLRDHQDDEGRRGYAALLGESRIQRFFGGADDSQFSGISADGSTAVGSATYYDTNTTLPVLWKDGEVSMLPDAPGIPNPASGPVSQLYGVNRDGTIGWGEERDADYDNVYTLWQEEEEDLRPLISVLQDDYGFDLSGVTGGQSSPKAFSVLGMNAGSVLIGTGFASEEASNLEERVWRARLVPLEPDIVINAAADRPDLDPEDEACDTGRTVLDGEGVPVPECTLRAALEEANARSGRDSITVDVQGAEPYVIMLTEALPTLDEPLVLDATTDSDYAGPPLLVVNGGGLASGFTLDQGTTTLRGLAIGGFVEAGVRITGPGGNRIEACHLGVGADGATAMPNGVGVVIDGSPNNVVGSSTREAGGIDRGNVIAGNADAGVVVTGASAAGNVVAGNRIGTNAAGTGAVPNEGEGVRIVGAPGTRVGGTTVEARNVIAGNATHGVSVQGAEAAGTTVAGNYIGVAADGAAALPNGTDSTFAIGHHGVLVASAPEVTIGGVTATPGAPPGNVIAGNAAHGVYVTGSLAGDGPADDVQVLGNAIGTGATGTTLLANGSTAVLVRGAALGGRIGQAGAGNLIVTAGRESGVGLFDLGETEGRPGGTQVSGNTLGFDASGNAVLGEMGIGVVAASEVDGGGALVVIGGEDAAAGNRIVAEAGIVIEGEGSEESLVASNVVGLKASGQLARAERDAYGIVILAAHRTQILGNTVAGQIFGVVLGSNENEVYLNRIGTDPAGTARRPNTIGLYIPGELEGGLSVGDRNKIGAVDYSNVISGNEYSGIVVGGDFEFFSGGEATVGKASVPTSTHRVFAATRASATHSVGHIRELDIAARKASATEASATETAASLDVNRAPDENEIAYNLIGVSMGGTRQLGNGRAGSIDDAHAGVAIEDGLRNQVVGNVISGNGAGVVITFNEETGGRPEEAVVAGNIIGSTLSSTTALPNQYGGVYIIGSPRSMLTTLPGEEGGKPVPNILRGNGEVGVHIQVVDADDVGNKVLGTHFLRNEGPSIRLIEGEAGDYPSSAPAAPSAFSAVAAEAYVRVRYDPGTTGAIEAFMSGSCEAGEAEGFFIGSVETSGGSQVLDLGYGATPASGPATVLEYYVALTVTEHGPAGMTSVFSDCVRVARETDVVDVPVAPGETGTVLNSIGLQVDVVGEAAEGVAPRTTPMKAAGTLYAARYDVPPQSGPLTGSATAPDGTTVTPTVVSSERSWTLRGEGLHAFTYDVCLDVEGLHGAEVPGQLLVVHRADAGEPWTPYASTLRGSQVCAAGLTALGELGIGGDGLVNPVPNEPAVMLPAAYDLTAYPNPARRRVTVMLALPQATEVRADVFDALGRRVALLHDGLLPGGTHVLALDMARLPAGSYIVRALTPTQALTRRLVVVR